MRALFVIAFAFLAVSIGCDEKSRTCQEDGSCVAGEVCNEHSECAAGWCDRECYDSWCDGDPGMCLADCRDGSICTDGTVCISLDDERAVCVAPCDGRVVYSDFFPGAAACVDGVPTTCDAVAAGEYCSACGCAGTNEYCDVATDTCLPARELGESCSRPEHCRSNNCSVANGAGDGVCLVRDGATCDDTNCDYCHAFGDGETYCQQTCDNNSQCAQGYCSFFVGDPTTLHCVRECGYQRDCPRGFYCDIRFDTSSCNEDFDCGVCQRSRN